MTTPSNSLVPDSVQPTSAATITRITNSTLLLTMRLIWLAVLLLVIVTAIIVVPQFFQWVFERSQINPVVAEQIRLLGISPMQRAIYHTALNILSIVFYLIGAILIFYLNRNNWMAWWTSLALILLAITPNAFSIRLAEFRPELTWLSAFLVYLAVLITIPLLYIFPDGRFVPRWTKGLLIVYLLWEGLRLFWGYFVLDDPLSQSSLNWNLPLIAVGLLGIPVRIYRHRLLSPVQRQQTKWFAFGMMLLVIFISLDFLPALPITPDPRVNFLIRTAIHSLMHVASWAFVVCIAIAITRYRLWDVNIVINRSLVYGTVTALLLVVFGGVIALVSALTQGQGQIIGVVVAAVAAMMLFNPAQRSVQNFVDRRIYGLRFDLNEAAAGQKTPDVKNPGLYTGRTLGKYQLLGVLGKGGMGEVYKGVHNEQTVAVKILPQDLAQKEDSRKRFERESQTLVSLEHPNIVKLFGSGVSDDGVHYLAMEFIDGHELSEIIHRGAVTDYDALRDWLKTVAAALDYIHDKGLVHRDLKPSNIMLRPSMLDREIKEAVLMDFGIARVNSTGTGLTGSGAVGTIDYMSPEQIMASREVDKRSDIYSLGIIVYELLTGERPFKGGAGQVLFAHLQQPVPDPRDTKPDLPHSIAQAVVKALSKDADDRFQSAGEFALALE